MTTKLTNRTFCMASLSGNIQLQYIKKYIYSTNFPLNPDPHLTPLKTGRANLLLYLRTSSNTCFESSQSSFDRSNSRFPLIIGNSKYIKMSVRKAAVYM